MAIHRLRVKLEKVKQACYDGVDYTSDGDRINPNSDCDPETWKSLEVKLDEAEQAATPEGKAKAAAAQQEQIKLNEERMQENARQAALTSFKSAAVHVDDTPSNLPLGTLPYDQNAALTCSRSANAGYGCGRQGIPIKIPPQMRGAFDVLNILCINVRPIYDGGLEH